MSVTNYTLTYGKVKVELHVLLPRRYVEVKGTSYHDLSAAEEGVTGRDKTGGWVDLTLSLDKVSQAWF
jgi:hypothetical protein